jgi:1-phosphofructokinase
MLIVPVFAPTLDLAMRAEAAIGAVSRAETTQVSLGGKALNVAFSAAAMGAPVHLIALAADWIEARIREQIGDAAVVTGVRATESSRIDVSIVAGDGTTTVVNSPPHPVSRVEQDAVLSRLQSVIERNDLLVIAGRQPGGIVERLLSIGAEAGARVVLDTSGPDLRTGAATGPEVVKVNVEELAEAFGISVATAWERGRSVAPQPGTLVITAGATGSRAWIGLSKPFDVIPPSVTAVSTLGAGDAVTAGIAAAMHEGATLREGLVMGTAWAAASAQSFASKIDPAVASHLRRQVRVTL